MEIEKNVFPDTWKRDIPSILGT
jgi:hypothetical protein